MISLGHSFRLLSRAHTDRPTDKSTAHLQADKKGKAQSLEDSKKRSFLKLAGVVGVGAVAASLIPKRADALVFGSTPTSNVVGMKNVLNLRVNPATEDTLASVKAQTDLLTFDGVSSPNLKVNVAAGDIGILNAANAVINPATEETLALIKTQTNKLTFDGSNNLLTASSGGSASIVGVKDTTGTQINPSTDDSAQYLRRIVKLMESQAVVDSGNRQRITLDSIGTGTAITTTVPVSGTVTTTTSLAAGANAIGSITAIDGYNHQMFQDFAKTAYATGIRQNLIFS
jgi:hypothetical protein